MKSRDGFIIIVLLWLLWPRSKSETDVALCYYDPDTGECLPVPDETE